MLGLLVLGALLASAPGRTVPTVVTVAPQSAPKPPEPLQEARRLGRELRYEEAVVQYQRYLAEPDTDPKERAVALVELGFIHQVLGDARSAQLAVDQALELFPDLALPSGAPVREARFFDEAKARYAERPRLEVLPSDPEAPERIQVSLHDPRGVVKTVLLRHALSQNGPYYSAPMRCEADACVGDIPPAKGAESVTAWYFVEAQDEKDDRVARAQGPKNPLRVTVVRHAAWYDSPLVYAGGAALLVGAAAIFYVASAPPSH